jgi:hypothetical protein
MGSEGSVEQSRGPMNKNRITRPTPPAGTGGSAQSAEPPYTDPYVRWCVDRYGLTARKSENSMMYFLSNGAPAVIPA